MNITINVNERLLIRFTMLLAALFWAAWLFYIIPFLTDYRTSWVTRYIAATSLAGILILFSVALLGLGFRDDESEKQKEEAST